MMLALVLAFFLQSSVPGRSSRHWTLVVQNSGAHRPNALAIISLLERLVATKPAEAQWTVVGFAEKFEQLDAERFRRRPTVLLPRTSDQDLLKETLGDLVFQGPSPVYDAVVEAMSSGAKPDVVLLISNGVDNASETEFDDLLKKVGQARTPVVSLYFPVQPPAGGDSRLRKLAKASGGKFIDIRAKDSWDQLLAALK